jgi:hypothetical protein
MDIECAVDSASVQTDINSFSLKHMAAKYVAEAKRKTSSLTSAQFMIQACSNIVEFIVTDIMSDMESLSSVCKSQPDKLAFPSVLAKLNSYSRPFEGLETEYMHKRYLEKEGLYVAPKTYVIGSTCGTVLDRKTGIVCPVMNDSTGQFIPITDTITALNNKTELIKLILTNGKKSCDGMLRTYFDGEHWDRHPANKEDELVIVLKLYVMISSPGTHWVLTEPCTNWELSITSLRICQQCCIVNLIILSCACAIIRMM